MVFGFGGSNSSSSSSDLDKNGEDEKMSFVELPRKVRTGVPEEHYLKVWLRPLGLLFSCETLAVDYS